MKGQKTVAEDLSESQLKTKIGPQSYCSAVVDIFSLILALGLFISPYQIKPNFNKNSKQSSATTAQTLIALFLTKVINRNTNPILLL